MDFMYCNFNFLLQFYLFIFSSTSVKTAFVKNALVMTFGSMFIILAP